jgi:hypothetical protein
MDRKLEVLVIEDAPQHLHDAQHFFRKNMQANITYASTYQEYRDAIAQHPFDGIITDVFFPYDSSPGTVPGWNKSVAESCYKSLAKTMRWYRSEQLKQQEDIETCNKAHPSASATPGKDYGLFFTAIKAWHEGDAMHPTGMLVVKEMTVQPKKIPIVVNSDAYHHSYGFEPVYRFLMQTYLTPTYRTWEGVYVVEGSLLKSGSWNLKMIETLKSGRAFERKNWKLAFDIILKQHALRTEKESLYDRLHLHVDKRG